MIHVSLTHDYIVLYLFLEQLSFPPPFGLSEKLKQTNSRLAYVYTEEVSDR